MPRREVWGSKNDRNAQCKIGYDFLFTFLQKQILRANGVDECRRAAVHKMLAKRVRGMPETAYHSGRDIRAKDKTSYKRHSEFYAPRTL
jgi:hypothetical protein